MDICLGCFLLLSQLKPNLAQPMTHETSPCLLLRLPSPNQTHIKIKREDRLFFFTQHTLHVFKKNPSPNSSLQNSRHYFFTLFTRPWSSKKVPRQLLVTLESCRSFGLAIIQSFGGVINWRFSWFCSICLLPRLGNQDHLILVL